MLRLPLVHRATAVALIAVLALAHGAALACGWWGENEGESDDMIVVLPGGAEAAETDLNDPALMARLSRVYRTGDGVPRDLALARSWAARAAAAGHAGAMNDLGEMFEAGLGGPADLEVAARWYRKAAMRGFANAQHSLATMLLAGHGLPRDLTAAEFWLRRSAGQGHETAAADLAVAIWAGLAAPRRTSEGCLWWMIALNLGHLGAAERCLDAEPALSDRLLGKLQGEAAQWSAQHRARAQSLQGDS